eukprot:6473955-Amphidinium_carterae.1
MPDMKSDICKSSRRVAQTSSSSAAMIVTLNQNLCFKMGGLVSCGLFNLLKRCENFCQSE